MFFTDLEPALVLDRTARMSVEISSYGVLQAARGLRYDPTQCKDVMTLYILRGSNIDRRDDELEAFQRWIAGCSPASS